jgi:hypothetical protein
MKTCLTALTLCALLCPPTLAEQLVPYDSLSQAPHFALFREQLELAVAERNAAFFRDRSKASGADFGMPKTLDQQFNLSDPNSPFWTLAQRMIELGGSWQPDTEMVVYPYAYADFPRKLDAFNHDVVIAKDVPLRSSSDDTSFEVGKLSYEIVWVLERDQKASRVRADNGMSGWIDNEFLYSPVDYRMGFSLMNGRWVMAYFISGD